MIPLEQTDTKFKYSLELGEGLHASTESGVSERSHSTTICPIFIICHISIAHFVLDHRLGDFRFETTGLMMLLFLQKIQ